MTRYIDADLLEEQFVNNCKKVGDSVEDWGMFDDDFYMMLKEVPTADVQPVIHAHWIRLNSISLDNHAYYVCSKCGRKIESPDYDLENYPYCYCGAKMDGDEHER